MPITVSEFLGIPRIPRLPIRVPQGIRTSGPCLDALKEADISADRRKELRAKTYRQFQYRLAQAPFYCECVAWGHVLENGEFEVWAGEIPAEIRKQLTLNYALRQGVPVSFELAVFQGDTRRTIGLLPVGYSTVILRKDDRPNNSKFGLDTHVLNQASLALREILYQHPLLRRPIPIVKPRKPLVKKAPEGPYQAFEREREAFETCLPELLHTYKGWFVAFRNGELIDKDQDEFALALRVEQQFQHEFVLVTQVSAEPKIGILDSPEGSSR